MREIKILLLIFCSLLIGLVVFAVGFNMGSTKRIPPEYAYDLKKTYADMLDAYTFDRITGRNEYFTDDKILSMRECFIRIGILEE